MVSASFAETEVEAAALAWLESLGYNVLQGVDIAPGEPAAERHGYDQAVLHSRLRDALNALNPGLPGHLIDEAQRKIELADSPSLVASNQNFHRMLVEGVSVEYQRQDGSIAGTDVRLVDFDNPAANDWLAVNQFTVKEGHGPERRADVVIFLNGLPVAVIELKSAVSEGATVWDAFNQLQTYKHDIPSLFVHNEALVISDGLQARIGTLTAPREWFMPWRTVEGERLAPASQSSLEVMLRGVFDHRRILDLVRSFTVFEDDGSGDVVKKMAGYHQFHAVNVAVEETVRASRAAQEGALAESGGRYSAARQVGGELGDRRAGVVWHTQGSGKSLTMAFYAGKLASHPSMENPTIVVITDRNDLDDQLFGVFSRCHNLVRQTPKQAEDRGHLRDLLKVASGGVVFTTAQKFLPGDRGDPHPLLSERRNIVVIADEAHRSQYDFIDGFARYMREALPNASFIGFTGTPIELDDKNTRAVFGDYISVYDIQQAVEDGATVPIYYESRLAKLDLDENQRPRLDEEFEEATEGEELEAKEKLKTKWAAVEALVGAEKRINLIAEDLVAHFEERQEAMQGKAMVVCMSRRICVDLYNAIVRLRPDWHSDDDGAGKLKVVMTGSASDPVEWQGHIRNKQRREKLAQRFKQPDDRFQMVIVRDMWLTGFDAPSLHTMYLDKPMRGHGLMQAIARVNRVFRDKPGGLVVDYLGLATELKKAMAAYTESGGTGSAAIDQDQAASVMMEKYEQCRDVFHGFDWSVWISGSSQDRLSLLAAAQDHVLEQGAKERYMDSVLALSKAFALAVPHEKALAIRDDVGFFQAVRAALVKSGGGDGERSPEELDHAIRQIISRAVSSDEVVDIFSAAGLKKPDISILSDEFLDDVRSMPHRNLAVETLQKLLNDEIKARSRKNLVQSRSFAEMLEESLRKYRNRAIQAAQVIEELIEMAKEMREADRRGEDLGMSEDELAFYDALETNDSAVQVLGDETLRQIAQELVETVRNNASIDWTVKESVRAKMRVAVRRILRKYGYPPDKQEQATQTVLQQAELLSREWAA